MKKALLLVDIQNDFLLGGALPTKNGNKILPVVNQLLDKDFDLFVASKDWHQIDHGSFAETHGKKVGERIQLDGLDQILWPIHCIQNSSGAEFPDSINSSRIDKVFFKGIDRNIDSYSTFFDNGKKRATGLLEYLKENGVDTLYVAGLATDYCVKYSVLDALDLGFRVCVIKDACSGVDLNDGDSEKALEEMQLKGAKIISSSEL